MENKLSVILTMYNTAELSKKIVEELVFQKIHYYPETEIIVVNDCSSDDTSFIKDYEKHIKYFDLKENHGCAGARNVGLDNATGQYVAFIDGDDMIAKEYLHAIYRVARENADYNFINWSLNGQKINPVFEFKNHPTEINKALWGYVFNRANLQMGHFNEMINVDSEVEYLQKLLTKEMSYGVVKKAVYDYNVLNENSLTRRFNRGEVTREKEIKIESIKDVVEVVKKKEDNGKKKNYKVNNKKKKKHTRI